LNSLPEKPDMFVQAQPDPRIELAAITPAEFTPGLDPVRNPPWTGLDVVRILVMTVLAFIFVFIAMSFAVPGKNFGARMNGLSRHLELQLLGQMVVYLLILAYMYVLVTRERRQPKFWQALRWNWPAHVWSYVLGGFMLQAVFLVLERFLPLPKEVPFDAVLRQPSSIVLVSVFSVTLGPLMEELFFRGFFYPAVRRHTGVAAAVVLTALPFALMHSAQYGNSWASVLLIFIVGVVLALVREEKNSLAASFLVHVGYNGTIIMLLFVATGGFRHLERLNQ
jgi:membrane protease YdiL (CAAX protease family)